MKYRPEIDGLRALAALSVVVFHIDKSWLPGGFLGVDIFFVISGFLISSIIVGRMESDSWSARDFYLRRTRRLAPALLATCLLTLLAAALIVSPSRLMETARSAVFSSLYVSNVDFWLQSGYFDAGAAYKPLLHTWSLSVEEQFYLIWPLIILLGLKASRKALGWLFAGLFLLSLVAATALEADQPSAIFFLMPFRIYEFAIGAMLLFVIHKAPIRTAVNTLLRLSGLALMIIPMFIIDGASSQMPLWSLLPCLGTCLVIFAGTSGGSHRILTNSVSRFLGRISYSLYLVHWPVITLAFLATLKPFELSDKLGLLALCLLLGWLLYKFVEQPFRYRKSGKPDQKPSFTPWLAGTVGVMAVGVAIIHFKGFEQRLGAGAGPLLASLAAEQTACQPAYDAADNVDACAFSYGDDAPIRLVLLGDSHADAMRSGFDDYARRQSINALSITSPGQLPLLDVTPHRYNTTIPKWREQTEDAVRRATELKPDLVILAGRWALPYHTTRPGFEDGGLGHLSRNGEQAITQASSRAALSHGLRATLTHFKAAGIDVLVLGQVPHLGIHPDECLARPGWITANRKDDCSYFTAAAWGTRIDPVDKMVSSIIEDIGHGRYIPLTPIFCEGRETCQLQENGRSLYHDDDHLSPDGARFLVSRIESDIASTLAEMPLDILR